ncbi:MAG: sugar phosphate isomerase/epimerase family protein [Acidobacteriota bacterium]|jgi:sugar phosphate isomerase/epimerase|nr:sugar phosphate isomerase/epimerase [Bryobacteraceae bacterium CoA2 C42]MCA2966111.1 sugar phosphate isomerase/epimerase [Acidobacteriaceae bacterium]
MNRRELLAVALGVSGNAWAKRGKIDRHRFGSITDESGATPAEALAFAQKHGLQWMEIRAVPGLRKHYADLTPEELKQAAREFREAGVKVSFFNSGQCKYLLPGTEALRSRQETPEQRSARMAREKMLFERREEDLRKSIRAAQAFGVDKVRIFAFLRTVDPGKDMQRIVDILGGLVKIAEREGIRLALENEVACNVARCDEMAAYVKAIPSKHFGLNWDALNGKHMHEAEFPEGYGLIPKDKLWNVQIKGKSILKQYADWIDWAPIFGALERDGYREQIGLECHIFGPDLIAKSHESMAEMIRIAEKRS